MNDFHKEIHSKPTDPYKKIQVSGVEQKKDSEEKKLSPSAKEEKGIFLYAILSAIKKILSFFSLKEKKDSSINLSSSANYLKENFQRLEKKDLSNDLSYLNDLSSSWKGFIQAYEEEYIHKEKQIDNVEKIISEINNHYGNQEFSLGFYLLKYGQEGWHPFPFINQLKNLHLEYLNKKSSTLFQKEIFEKSESDLKKASLLEKWIFYLDKII